MCRQTCKTITGVLAFVLAVGMAAFAQAAVINTLHFDINNVTVAATGDGGFTGTSYTGTLTLSPNGNTGLVGIDFYDDEDDTISQTISPGSPSIQSLSGTINISSGNITGGTLSFTVKNSDTSLHTYTAPIVSYPGGDIFPPSPYSLSGEADPTAMDSNYAGVDVSMWSTQLANDVGSFLLSNLYTGSSQNAGQLDVYVVVPEPASLGLIGLGLISALRFRRQRIR